MTYKEKIQREIKEDKLRELWEKIAESYEQGGVDSIKMELNSLTEKIKNDYNKVLAKLENML